MKMFARINICVFSFLGNQENVEKFQKRLVKVTKEHNDECKQLLKLMGIPYVDVSTTAKNNIEMDNAFLSQRTRAEFGKYQL